jgi:branched-chain amino acid transport system ATP-binding protein
VPTSATAMPSPVEALQSASGRNALLKVEHLEAGYRAVQVLWGFSLEVYPREVIALVGSNGAGKTTLLRALSGVLNPWKGDIIFEGRSVVGLPSHAFVRAGISHVPEGRRLFAGLTVEANLRMGAFTRTSGADRDQDLERVYGLFPELAERRQQLAGTLSGGQQQMVAIGRGLMAGPKLLLIDELSLGLAPVIVDRMVEAIRQLREAGSPAILLVDQDIQVALTFADRGYVMEMGRQVLSGPAQELAQDTRVREAYLGL